jgi:anti-sigma factor RsiW
VNRMVNEAVGEYLASRAAAVEADLEETLRRVRAYREGDPHFESAIAKFADEEAALANEDPVEGKTTSAAGPAQRLVRQLIRG